MRALTLSLLLCILTTAAYAELKVEKSFKIDKDTKFSVLRFGEQTSEGITQMEDNTSYCAIENYKFKPLTFKKGQKLTTNVSKLSFPNKEIQRFNVFENKDYTIFCDFTASQSFHEENVIKEISDQLAGFMTVTK